MYPCPLEQDLRASDRDREGTVERLRVAAGEGYLDEAELEDRVTRALEGRTRAALAKLIVDLPLAEPPARPRRALLGRLRRRHAVFGGVTALAYAGWAAEVGARDPLILGQSSEFPWPLLVIAAWASAEAVHRARRPISGSGTGV